MDRAFVLLQVLRLLGLCLVLVHALRSHGLCYIVGTRDPSVVPLCEESATASIVTRRTVGHSCLDQCSKPQASCSVCIQAKLYLSFQLMPEQLVPEAFGWARACFFVALQLTDQLEPADIE